jgi:hypothetical protein
VVPVVNILLSQMGAGDGAMFREARLYIGVVIAEFSRHLPQRFIGQGGYSGDDVQNPLF